MALTAENARAVLAQAKADETYEAPIPEDDSTAISEAQELVDQARAAWEANIRGPEVEAILKLAGDDDGDGDGSEEESGDENLAEIEPWEDYDKDDAKGVKAALDWTLENEAHTFADLAKHVWEYESENKSRKGILDHLAKLAEQAGVSGSDDEPEAEAEPDGDELGGLDRDELKKTIKSEGLGTLLELGINKNTTDDEIREIIRSKRPEPEAPEEEPEAEPEAEPEPEPEAEEETAEPEQEEEPKPKRGRKKPAPAAEEETVSDNGTVTITLTREMILAALSDGAVNLEIG